MKHVLFPVEELRPGQMRSVTIDSIGIVVVRSPNGEVRALRDRCAHFDAKLSNGSVLPLWTANQVSDYGIVPNKFVIKCPWHGYEFDIDTGVCPADPRHVRVRAYPVTIEDGNVVVERTPR